MERDRERERESETLTETGAHLGKRHVHHLTTCSAGVPMVIECELTAAACCEVLTEH